MKTFEDLWDNKEKYSARQFYGLRKLSLLKDVIDLELRENDQIFPASYRYLEEIYKEIEEIEELLQ